MSHRVSDHVDLFPCTLLRFQGLSPGLPLDFATTVTITGEGVPGNTGGVNGGGGNTVGNDDGARAPGIDPAVVVTVSFPRTRSASSFPIWFGRI